MVICFCDNKDESLKTDQSVLRSLLHQLYTSKASLIRHAMPSYKQMKEGVYHSTGTMWKILRATVKDVECGPVFCILDGLEECDSESQKCLLHNLSQVCYPPAQITADVYPNRLDRFKILVTSRPWPYIERGFYGVPHIRLRSE